MVGPWALVLAEDRPRQAQEAAAGAGLRVDEVAERGADVEAAREVRGGHRSGRREAGLGWPRYR